MVSGTYRVDSKVIVPGFEWFPPSFSTCILTQAEINTTCRKYSRKYGVCILISIYRWLMQPILPLVCMTWLVLYTCTCMYHCLLCIVFVLPCVGWIWGRAMCCGYLWVPSRSCSSNFNFIAIHVKGWFWMCRYWMCRFECAGISAMWLVLFHDFDL